MISGIETFHFYTAHQDNISIKHLFIAACRTLCPN